MNVSRETIDRLKVYENLLLRWQQKMNLVSPQTLPHLWERHFLDSLQLLSYLPELPQSLVDLGSGAGFPGMVLAICRRKTLQVTLLEANEKKCFFLENVSRETMTPVQILRSRIENLSTLKADVITARALAPLVDLLAYAYPLMTEQSFCLFLKGKDTEEEIQMAKKKWNFDLEIYPSLTDPRGKILKITHLQRICPDDEDYSCCESKRRGGKNNHSH